MKAKEFIPASKPRNFVAKNQKTAGAGAHRDMKRAEKQGDVKHKKDLVPMEGSGGYYYEQLAQEVFDMNPNLDASGRAEEVLDAAYPLMVRDLGKKAAFGKLNYDEDFPSDFVSAYADLQKQDESMSERVRDPEDWDEGNTEPPNNFAIYINGKKWKVFKGRGQFADDYRENQHYQQLKDWARKKSEATGKKWEVYITGENPTESLELDEISWKEIKQGAAAAGLAGALALGSGAAQARVSGDEDPGVNRLTGKPNITQVAPSDSEKSAVVPLSNRYGPGYEGSPAAYTITVKGQDYKFAGRDKDGPGTGPIIKVPAGAVGFRGLAPVNVELGKDGMFYSAPR